MPGPRVESRKFVEKWRRCALEVLLGAFQVVKEKRNASFWGEVLLSIQGTVPRRKLSRGTGRSRSGTRLR